MKLADLTQGSGWLKMVVFILSEGVKRKRNGKEM
jgi:hypothetical protein